MRTRSKENSLSPAQMVSVVEQSPLVWPDFISRSKTRDFATHRFGIIDAVVDIYRKMIEFGHKTGKPVENVVVSYNQQVGDPNDTGAALYFRWGGVEYAFAVDRYYSLEGNLSALRFIIMHMMQLLSVASIEIVALGMIGFTYVRPAALQEQ